MSKNDATRFTPTGVWTHTKPGSRATIMEFADPAPKNETPQQKVKRLRAAANRAKVAQITTWDIVYMYGRMAADMAHKATVYGIVFATGALSIAAVFSIGDMIIYNRRKRRIYYEEQEKQQAEILALARAAVAQGVATPAQTALVEGIREEEEAWAKKVAERHIGSKLLWWLHGNWNERKELAEQRRLAVEDVKKENAQGVGITQAVWEARGNAAGGPLDQTAENAAASAEKASKGFLGWMWGSKKEDSKVDSKMDLKVDSKKVEPQVEPLVEPKKVDSVASPENVSKGWLSWPWGSKEDSKVELKKAD